MKKRALSLLLSLAMVISLFAGIAMTVSATDLTLTFDFSSNPGDWPTTKSATAADYTYTLDNETYTFSLLNAKYNGGYVLFGKDGASIGMPAIGGYKLKSVNATSRSGASANVKVGISDSASTKNYITGGDAVQWTPNTGNWTYTLSDTAVNTMYYLYVDNAYNAQLTQLVLVYEGVTCTHDNVAPIAAVAATCTTAGNIAYYYCPDCGTYFTDSTFETTTTLAAVTIVALGHTWSAWSVTTSATCTEDGEQTRTCSACQATETETIPATGHTYVDGVCSVCGAEATATYVLTTSLRDGDEVIIYNVSAGKAMSEDTVSTNYRAGVDVTVSGNKIVTDDSKIVWKVTASGDSFIFTNDEGETLSATKGLSFASTDNIWEVNTATTANSVYLVSSTATSAGSGDPKSIYWYDKYSEFSTYYYSEPSESIFAMQLFVKGVIAPENCVHENTTTTGSVAASCTFPGHTAAIICEDCRTIIEQQEIIPALGHNFVDGFCTRCGAEAPATYVLTTSLRDGDEVIIYNASAGKAMSEDTVSTNYRAGVDVTVSGNKIVTDDSKIVWKVTASGDGFIFTNDEGETLSATKGLSFASTDNVWLVNAATTASSVYLVSTTAIGTSSYPKYVEWYAKYLEFTTYYYSESSEAIFAMQLFVKNTHEHIYEDGICMICGAVDTSVIDLKIVTASLTLYQDIAVNFTASVPEGVTDPYMVIEINDQSYTVTPKREDSQGRPVFEFMNLTPDMMGDNIKATLYATTAGGRLVHYCKPTYSVKQYCTNVMAAYPEDAKLQTLLADMLVYGAATQCFTGHNADNLVTEGLNLSAASTFEDLTSTDFARTGTTDPNIQWTGAGLECGSQMSMYFTLNTTAGEATSVEITINGRTTVYSYSDMIIEDESDFGATCRVTFRGISASEYGDVVTAILKNNGEQVGQTLTYSVNSYVYSKQNNTAVENLAQLVQAIYNYGASAKSYLN